MTAPRAAISSRSQRPNDHDGLCPNGRLPYPTPNDTKSASRSGQNRGRIPSRRRPSTLLRGCDGFATPVRSPKPVNFYLLALNEPLARSN
jgi:hypothetical protein